MMRGIRILPSSLVDQIAAGEVVERPYSVVKELVENALDAGATFIEVEINKGGREKILVRDNGEGMSRKDAPLSLRRHTTSKIVSIDDLAAIKTFGFRGEALSSIAAVSKFNLKTKTANLLQGTEVLMEPGKEPVVHSCSHPQGTSVIVSDLFSNLPARRKFLKTEATEFKYIRDWLLAQTLVYPAMGFRLRHDGREVFHFPENQSSRDRLELALDIDLTKFASVSLKTEYVGIEGFAGLPELARQRKHNQFLFVNKRYLQNKTVWAAMKKAYRELLPENLHPPYFLDLIIREDLVDVNVHPRKEEVKFVSPAIVFDAVANAVYSALSQKTQEEGINLSVRQSPPSLPLVREVDGRSSSYSRDTAVHPVPFSPRSSPHMVKDRLPLGETYGEASKEIYQLAQLYLLIFEKDGMVIIDQHAAEERVLFEEFLGAFRRKQSRGAGQELLFPISFKLTSEETKILREHIPTMEKIGFRLDLAEDDQLVIETVPVCLKDRDIGKILREYLDDYLSEQETLEFEGVDFDTVKVDRQTLEALAYLACRGAVKQGDVLTPFQRQNLVRRLEDLKEKGLTCPHGRPTKIRISLTELHRRFKRQ